MSVGSQVSTVSRCDCGTDDLVADDAVVVPADLPDDWRCPRRATDGGSRCEFHRPPETTGANSADANSATRAVRRSLSATPDADAFADVVELDGRRLAAARKRFVGARFETVDLSEELIERTDTLPIDLRATRIDRLVLRDARIESDVRLDGSSIGSIDASGATIAGSLGGDDLTVEGPCRLDGASIDGDVRVHDGDLRSLSFEDARIGGRLELNDLAVEGDVRGADCVVDGRFEFKEGTVGGGIRCPGMTLRGEKRHSNTSELTFRKTSTAAGVSLEQLRSDGAILLNDLDVGGDLRLDDAEIDDSLWLGAVDNESTTLGSVDVAGSLSVRNGRVRGDLDAAESVAGTEPGPVVGANLDLSGARVDGELLCSPTLDGEAFSVVRLVGAHAVDGALAQPTAPGASPVLYDLRHATLGPIRLGTSTESADRFHLVETTFDGFEFGRNRAVLDAADWRIHELYDGGYADLALASVAREATALADDLLAAATVEGFVPALTGSDPVADATAAFDGVDWEPVANGAESPREAALPAPFDDRESERKGLVRGLAETECADDADPTPHAERVAAVLRDRRVAERLSSIAPATDPSAYPATDPERAPDRTGLVVAVADALAEPDAFEPTADELVTTYLLAKNGANRVGDIDATSRLFQNEMRYRRRIHRESLAERSGLRDTARSAYDYGSNVLFDATSGYGERPRRVFAFSVGTVLLFALGFVVLLPEPPYGSPIGYLVLSLESFVTLILGGGAEHSSPTIRLMATIEGFTGAFLIALFVFTLTRSIDR